MAFEELVDRISPVLKKIARRARGPFVFVDEDDLFQEALLHLWQEFGAGRFDGKTESYILQGCYFHLKNYMRGFGERYGVMSLEEAGLEETGEGYVSPEALKHARDGLGDIEAGLLATEERTVHFTAREKDVFSLSLEGLTVREIGARLGISHVRVVHLKNRLKTKISFVRAELRAGKNFT